MGMAYNELRDLAIVVAKAENAAPIAYSFGDKKYSYADLQDVLRDELKELAGSYNAYRRNKLTIFELMQEVIDEVLPNKVIAAIGRFAEVRQYGQGQKAIFKKKAGKIRAKAFITKVGLSGIYETFTLDNEYFEVNTMAFGGAAQVGFERFLDGTVDFADLLDVIVVGLEEAIYTEVQSALKSATSKIPAANQASVASFDAAAITKLKGIIDIVKAYGGNANIFCTSTFAAGLSGDTGSYFTSDIDRAEYRDMGYVGKFHTANVIVLPQSYNDLNNTETVIDPEYAYIMPTGGQGSEQVVKVALEGDTVIDEVVNVDRSREIQAYKKFGVAVLSANHYGIFRNTGL